jgi:hypothetical protein
MSAFIKAYSWGLQTVSFDGTNWRFWVPENSGSWANGGGFSGYWVTPPASITYYMPDLGRGGFPTYWTNWVYWCIRATDTAGNQIVKPIDSYSGSGTWHTVTGIATGYLIDPATGAWDGNGAETTLTNPLTNIEFLVDDRKYMDCDGWILVAPFVGTEAPAATGRISKAAVSVIGTHADTITVGDVELVGTGAARDAMKYMPGAVLFQNCSQTGTFTSTSNTSAPFQGPLYVGYQSPVPYVLNGDYTKALEMLTCMRDAQLTYTDILQTRAGVTIQGPFAPVYLHPIWDCAQYVSVDNPLNQFGWAGPDPNTFWGGFQYRAFYNVADYWQRCVAGGVSNGTVPLAVTICQSFIDWLEQWLLDNPSSINIPISFYPDSAPYTNYSDTHTTANALSGAIFMKMAVGNTPQIDRVVARLYSMLLSNQQTYGDMIGCFSPDASKYVFYGYWAGEIMNAISLMKLEYPVEFATWDHI